MSIIDEVAPPCGAVCDLFAGSGTVSLALSARRPVVSVDIQEYSKVLCSALVAERRLQDHELGEFLAALRAEFSKESRLASATKELELHENRSLELARSGQPESLCDIIENGSVLGVELGLAAPRETDLDRGVRTALAVLRQAESGRAPIGTMIRQFGGIYFSYRQARELDTALNLIARWETDCPHTLLASALGSASEIVNTVGKQFAQPIVPRHSDGSVKTHLLEKIQRDRSRSVFKSFERCLRQYASLPGGHEGNRVLCADYREALPGIAEIAAIYADPPYTRDHYSRYYHVLETMAKGDAPEVSTAAVAGRRTLSRGLYRVDRHQSPFCIKRQAPHAFAELFSLVRTHRVPLILSYSPYGANTAERPRLLTIDHLLELAKRHYSKVEVRSAGRISHNKLNTTDRNVTASAAAELFVICRP